MEIAPSVFNCSCPNGFTGKFCEKKITYYLGYDILEKTDRMTNNLNPCLSRPCLNEGVCLLKSIGYSCICGLQYTGSNCEYLINHCVTNPCLNGGTCLNTFVGYICSCSEKFTGNHISL